MTMDNNEILDQGFRSSEMHNNLSSMDKDYLKTAAKWAKFLGIMGFIFTGIIIFAGLMMFTMGSYMMSSFPSNTNFSGGMFGAGLSFLYLMIALPYFFISLYMYRFSTKTQAALHSSNDMLMTEAFKNLRNYFRLMGFFVVAVIVLYFGLIIYGIGTASMMR